MAGLLLEAEREFSQAIRFLPTVTQYYLHRATASYERGNHAQAVRDYRRIVELDPEDHQADP
jgi:tetratricopeptide (TPR) repeat protein